MFDPRELAAAPVVLWRLAMCWVELAWCLTQEVFELTEETRRGRRAKRD